MRTGRARLIETIGDALFEATELDQSHYWDVIAAYQLLAEPWADRIMEDINLGIITAEVDG